MYLAFNRLQSEYSECYIISCTPKKRLRRVFFEELNLLTFRVLMKTNYMFNSKKSQMWRVFFEELINFLTYHVLPQTNFCRPTYIALCIKKIYYCFFLTYSFTINCINFHRSWKLQYALSSWSPLRSSV